MDNDFPCNNTRSKNPVTKQEAKSKAKPKYKSKSRNGDEVDSNGNLKGFIVPDNYVEYEDGTMVIEEDNEEINFQDNLIESQPIFKKTNRRKSHNILGEEEKSELKSMASNILLSALLSNGLGNSQKRDKKRKFSRDRESDSESFTDSEGQCQDGDESDYNEEDEKWSDEEEKYFKGLSKESRDEIDKLESALADFKKNDVPYRFKILKNNYLDIATKSFIIEKLDQFYMMDPGDNEYHKLNRWVEGIMKVPFGKYSKPMVSLEDGPEKVSEFLNKTKSCLDIAVYGHETTKATILQSVAMMITNPDTKGKVLALQGPMGNGKTTLIREGVAKAMGRPFAFVALGGATDSATLEGHDFTYEGSHAGRIVNILKECGTMDPIICFDELDKLSETPKGEEIANLLCHLTDHSQNSQFHDRYFSGIDFNLSRATFIFSFNDITKVNPILLDRINVIKTNGFKSDDKLKIAQKFLIPDLCKDIGFRLEDLLFNDEVLKHIIQNYTEEKGVRSLKRHLETIISKVNLLKIIKAKKVVCEKSDKSDSKVDDNTQPVVSDKSDKNESRVEDRTRPVEIIINKQTLQDTIVKVDKTDRVEETDKVDKQSDKDNSLVSYHIKNLTFPLEIDCKIVELLLKENKKEVNTSLQMLYI